MNGWVGECVGWGWLVAIGGEGRGGVVWGFCVWWCGGGEVVDEVEEGEEEEEWDSPRPDGGRREFAWWSWR